MKNPIRFALLAAFIGFCAALAIGASSENISVAAALNRTANFGNALLVGALPAGLIVLGLAWATKKPAK